MSAQQTSPPSAPAALSLQGGCLCGQVRYRAQARRLTAMVCHCRDCQKQSGSAFSVIFGIAAADVTWLGALHTHAQQADSGRRVHRRFCPDCGSPLVTEVPERPGTVFIKAGTLDDPSVLQPALHLWCQSKQPWVSLPEGVTCLATQP